MDLKREHTIEMLLLIAAVAVVQLPASAPTGPAPGTGPGTTLPMRASAMPVHEVRTEPLASQRLDPIGLLQAGVPDDWRIALPETKRAAELSNTC